MITPTFGQMLKAFRLCYGWSYKHQCFIRMTPIEPETKTLIELAPPDAIPANKSKLPHAIWYEGKGSDEILSMIEPLQSICGVKRYTSFYVDEHGARINP